MMWITLPEGITLPVDQVQAVYRIGVNDGGVFAWHPCPNPECTDVFVHTPVGDYEVDMDGNTVAFHERTFPDTHDDFPAL